MKLVEIAGGGLAGLSLGIALRAKGVPVTIYEAGHYPRHRVCGEFICGVEPATLERLGISELFEASPRYGRSVWFRGDDEISRNDLPSQAWGISRYVMDEWLRERFEALGGDLQTGVRARREAKDGLVWTAGRVPTKSDWIGLKTHIRGYPLTEPLEMHMGKDGYAGLVEVEHGWINICGLFKKRSDISARKDELLPAYLEACGLKNLASQVRGAEWRGGAFSAVAGFALGAQPNDGDLCVVGDAESMIPPFTGNGMSMAFEAADIATLPLAEWSCGAVDWSATQRTISRRLKNHFSARLRVAQSAHGMILGTAGQAVIAALSKTNLLPFRTLFSLTR